MTLNQAISNLTHVLRRERYSEKTVEAYSGWINRFFAWIVSEKQAGKTYETETGIDLDARVTSHAFRHGFATALLHSGRPIQEVAQLLGHVSIETTQIYLHCLPRLEERLVSPLDTARNLPPFRKSA